MCEREVNEVKKEPGPAKEELAAWPWRKSTEGEKVPILDRVLA